MSIETEIWEKHETKEHVVVYCGQRPALEVFKEVEKAVMDRFKYDDNAALDYIQMSFMYNKKDIPWKHGQIAVFVTKGGSEGHYVNVCVLHPAEPPHYVITAKLFSEEGAHDVCKFIQRLFYIG